MLPLNLACDINIIDPAYDVCNMIVVSGKGLGKPLRLTSGHTKIGELIGFSTKIAVAEALKKHDG